MPQLFNQISRETEETDGQDTLQRNIMRSAGKKEKAFEAKADALLTRSLILLGVFLVLSHLLI